MDNIKTVSQCRLCNSSDIYEILNFGEVPLANSYRESADLTNEFRAPLRYFQCQCGSVQLYDEVDSSILFSNYSYSSPPNLQSHFSEYARTTAQNCIGLSRKDLIVGIGGNNGILEREYQKLGFDKVINVEPATNIAKLSESNGITTINKFFNPTVAAEIVAKYGNARLVTGNNFFAHVSNLNEIVEGIKILIGDFGWFVFENAYLLNTIFSSVDVGQFYHEHFYAHSIKPLKKFFEKHGMSLVCAQLNNVQMGSFRIYATNQPKIRPGDYSINNLIKLEEDFGLYRADTYKKFSRDVEWSGGKLISQLKDVIDNCDRNAKECQIALYGVPAKIVLLIKIWGLGNYISYAVEDSPIKWGKFIPGTKIPIRGPDYWAMENPAATLIGAYNFADDIINKNPNYKGGWIIPFK